MADKYALTKRDIEQLSFSRWVLFVINAAEASGIDRVNRRRLHSLLFMSFAAAPYYKIKPLRQRAQRTPHGPYYRAAHIALGSLTLSDLISISDFKSHVSPGGLQFEATFSPTLKGLEVGRVLRKTNFGSKLYQFILDLCLSFAELIENSPVDDYSKNHTMDTILERDLSYQQAISRDTNSLFLSEASEDTNPTLSGLKKIDQRLRSQNTFNNRDILRAYQRLLKKRAA